MNVAFHQFPFQLNAVGVYYDALRIYDGNSSEATLLAEVSDGYHYNVKVSNESMMDFEMLFKTAEETHRQFYERLLQHTRKHLAPANVKVENYTNTAADTMSISLMNMVAED